MTTIFIIIIIIIIPVTPWFESKDKKTVAKKLRDDLTLECGARGYPLKVEWKFKSETNETVKPCISKFELEIIRKILYCLSVSGLVPSLHSISREVSHAVCSAVYQPLCQLASQRVLLPVSQSVDQSVGLSVGQSICQLVI